MEKIKWAVSVLLGFLGSFTQQYSLMILLVCIAIVFDFLTGLVKAKIEEKISSQTGTKGFFKKISLLVCLFFGFFLDYAIPYMLSCVNISLAYDTPFGMIISFYIVLNECISIAENLYACNPDIMPKWIVKFLLQAKNKIDDMEKDEKAVSDNEDLQEK